MDEQKDNLPIGVGKFAKPVELAGVTYTHFTMREANIQDMFDVEMELSQSGRGTHTPLAFNGEMMIRQLVRVTNAADGKSHAGPFTMNMLKNFGVRNYRAIREKQLEIDMLGEAE